MLAWISFSSYSGDSCFPFDCRSFLSLLISGNSFCFFLHLRLLCFHCQSFWGGLLWYELCGTQVQSLWSPDLDAPRMSFIQFMWVLLSYLGFYYWWAIHWWVLASSWLTGSPNPCLILYAVVQVRPLRSVFCNPGLKISYQLRFHWLFRCFVIRSAKNPS